MNIKKSETKWRGKLGLGMIFIFLTATTIAQNLSQHNWYFGSTTSGIKFNRGNNKPSIVTNQALPFGTGGAAVATDPATANLLFYSDGTRVYDACHIAMRGPSSNPFLLTGNSSANQPVAVSAVPGVGNEKKYFVFVNTANFTTGGVIKKVVVDLALPGSSIFPSPTTGEIESAAEVSLTGLTNRSEGMIVVPHANGTDFWLISHQVNSNNYSATPITALQYTSNPAPVLSSPGGALPLTVANFAYHAKSKKLAVAPQTASDDALILNFNDATGTLTFDRPIINSATASTGQSIYDIEWDRRGRFLYISVAGSVAPPVTADVLQYDYLNPTTTLASVLPSPKPTQSFGLQTGPDTTMYHIYQSGVNLRVGSLLKTDSVASKVVYNTAPFGTTNFAGTQFPSFLPKANVNLTVTFTFIGTCQNSPTSFFPDVKPGADSLRWDFGDTNNSNGWSPVHTYAQPQTYNVSLTAFYQGQMQSVTQPVTISSFALQLQLVQDTAICKCEFPNPYNTGTVCPPGPAMIPVKASGGVGVLTYQWSNEVAPTDNMLKPAKPGYYYVVVTDAGAPGCSAFAGVNVREYKLQDQRANKWFFGNNAGIDFNSGAPVAISNPVMNAPEGCAIICDRNGETIFFTDGKSVYRKDFSLVPSLPVTGLAGDPLSSQSSLIMPVPGDETLYYIFTTQAIDGSPNELRYSLYDLKLDNGKGDLVPNAINILLFSRSTERITSDGQWLIAHEYGNNTFRSYQITPNGIGLPVFSAVGSDHSFKEEENGMGYMKLGPGSTLAVPLSSPGTNNLIELFHLNDTTGQLNNYKKIDLNEPNGQVYGIEFSAAENSGSKLFATVLGATSKVFEYYVDSLMRPTLVQSLTFPARLGAIQTSPLGQPLYIAVDTAPSNASLGSINPNPTKTAPSSITLSGFVLLGSTNSRLGLPNFAQNISSQVSGPGINVSGTCAGQPTTFSASPDDPSIDLYSWRIMQGSTTLATDTRASFDFTFLNPGTYTAVLNITNKCIQKGDAPAIPTFTRTVTIFGPPLTPPGAAALCPGGFADLNPTPEVDPDLTYLWSNGSTQPTIRVFEQALVSVTITNTKTGCVTTQTIIAADPRPPVDLGPDIDICQNTSGGGPILNTNINSAFAPHTWKLNGTPLSNTSSTQQVDITTAIDKTYIVTVIDPAFPTCLGGDTITYHVKPAPLAVLTGSDPIGACGSPTGSIRLDINSAPSGGPYTYSFVSIPPGPPIPPAQAFGIDINAPFNTTINGRVAGTYSVIVTDQISQCTTSVSRGLSDATFNATPSLIPPLCAPLTVRVVTTSPGPTLQYSLIGNSTIGPVSDGITHDFTNVPVGTYVVEVRDVPLNCIRTINNFSVTANPSLVLTPVVNECTTPPTISVTSNSSATFLWSGAGISGTVNTPTTTTISLNTAGTYSLVATPVAAGLCPANLSQTVALSSEVTDFTFSDQCASTVRLTATPQGNYAYTWLLNGNPSSALIGSRVDITQSGNYSVTVRNFQTGCSFTSTTKAVSVVGPISASLTSTPACDDNKPFTLTATSVATGVSYAWFFNNSTTPIAGANAATLDQTAAGNYKVEISKATCKATSSIQITKSPVPVGTLPPRAIICDDPDNNDPTTKQIDLNPGTFNKYSWFKNDLTLNYTKQILTADTKGIYKVELTNIEGCVASDQTEVRNDCFPKITGPNAFRPTSGQGTNKEFFVYSFFITDQFEVFIYNRWGELVFQSNDRNFRWNGNYNNTGAPLPGGTYVYIVKYTSSFRPEKGVQEQRGGVVLLR